MRYVAIKYALRSTRKARPRRLLCKNYSMLCFSGVLLFVFLPAFCVFVFAAVVRSILRLWCRMQVDTYKYSKQHRLSRLSFACAILGCPSRRGHSCCDRHGDWGSSSTGGLHNVLRKAAPPRDATPRGRLLVPHSFPQSAGETGMAVGDAGLLYTWVGLGWVGLGSF